MAEEQDLIAELEAAEAQKGGFPWKWVLIVVLAAALGAGGYFTFLYFQNGEAPAEKVTGEGEAPGAKEAAPQDAKKEEEDLGVMVSLDPFIINLAGSKGKRFLKVTMTLELNDPSVQEEVRENLQRIIDSILILLSSKTFQEVYSIQGKFKLKDEITTRVNRFLLMGHVKDVYFTEFVIQ